MTTSTKDLIAKANHLAFETWVNGEGLGGELSETFTKLGQRLRELDEQVKQQINDYGRGMAIVDLMPKPDCVWINGDSDKEFDTSCGHTFTFIDGGIEENDCKFCQYCGGAVKSGGTHDQ
jgi:hypothetical protein